jgi:hypothetical protein
VRGPVSFHIVFSSFTIGLAAWLTILEALHLWIGVINRSNPAIWLGVS